MLTQGYKSQPKYNFFLYTNVSHGFVLFILRTLRLFKLKTEGQTASTKNLTIEVRELKSKFSLTLGYLNQALNNPAPELRF